MSARTTTRTIGLIALTALLIGTLPADAKRQRQRQNRQRKAQNTFKLVRPQVKALQSFRRDLRRGQLTRQKLNQTVAILNQAPTRSSLPRQARKALDRAGQRTLRALVVDASRRPDYRGGNITGYANTNEQVAIADALKLSHGQRMHFVSTEAHRIATVARKAKKHENRDQIARAKWQTNNIDWLFTQFKRGQDNQPANPAKHHAQQANAQRGIKSTRTAIDAMLGLQ